MRYRHMNVTADCSFNQYIVAQIPQRFQMKAF